jgi:hypothetical protein
MSFEANTNVDLVKGIQATADQFEKQLMDVDLTINALKYKDTFRGFRRFCEFNKIEFTGDSVSNAEIKMVLNYAPIGYFNPKREIGVVNKVFTTLVKEHFGHREVEFDVIPEFFQVVLYVPLRAARWVDMVVRNSLNNIHYEFLDVTKKGTLQKRGYKEILTRYEEMHK